MEKKTLYMIGNSHIDPVWFWTWEEGMQEVKATFASALERMKEYPDFRFTCTSTAFLEWIEKLCPEMFQEICVRVREGRWELTGGWFIEPDCNLPCGEAFVRQGLYGQRFLKSRFQRTAKIGSNVDSFGHNHVLPQILKKSGMDAYVFMRPRLGTPLFFWEAEDGSRVRAICLPGEYTTWFHDPTVKNIEETLERTEGQDKMVCCYGVGNHGGGPTIENIESIRALKDSFPGVVLKFSTYGEFIKETEKKTLPVLTGPFEKVNEGCYGNDSLFKKRNRQAQRRLLEADGLMSMAACMEGKWMKETGAMEELWKGVLFNQFHDTMGGTIIESAREEAVMQLGGVCAKAGEIRALAMQRIANLLDTTGRGFPLILWNPSSIAFCGETEAELEWFCQSPLKLLSPEGKEIPYQRIHTDAKVRHTTLGGRRRFVFEAEIPPYGFAVYRVCKEEPSLASNQEMEILNPDSSCLENRFLRADFDRNTGNLVSLVEKQTGYDALQKPACVAVYRDERDAWGGLQGRVYERTDEELSLVSMEKIESGPLREVIRVRQKGEKIELEQCYILGKNDRELRVECRLNFYRHWTLLKAAYPLAACCSLKAGAVTALAESAYGTLQRQIHPQDSAEYYMHRFVDLQDEAGAGLYVANDGKYGFHLSDNALQITICRSPIYAQGNSPDWYNETESYHYMDQGEQRFRFLLRPHRSALHSEERFRMAWRTNGEVLYLADSAHDGLCQRKRCGFFSVDMPNVQIAVVKKCEDDESFIIRLLETEGKDTEGTLCVGECSWPFSISHHEILTVKVKGREVQTVNLLEWENE